MKKLMLAAVAAAMIGGLQAAPVAGDVRYNFVAVLRTTGAAPGTATPTAPVTRQFSLRGTTTTFAATDWWYNDATVAGLPTTRAAAIAAASNLYLGTAVVGGQVVPHLYLVDATNVSATDQTTIDNLATTYNRNQIINGVPVWCCTITYSGVNAAKCYRIASVDRIQDTLYLNACCTANFLKEVDDSIVITYQGGADADLTQLPNWFIHGFGGQTTATCLNNEIFAMAETTTVAGRWFNGFIAGQGTWIAVATKGGARYPNMISGNIVGVEQAPQCVTCCAAPTGAVAFSCAATSGSTAAPGSTVINTAAFGTFYITYAGIY